LPTLTQNIANHLLLIIGNLNMSYLTEQYARAIGCAIVVLLPMRI
jgi:hypothetical protein